MYKPFRLVTHGFNKHNRAKTERLLNLSCVYYNIDYTKGQIFLLTFWPNSPNIILLHSITYRKKGIKVKQKANTRDILGKDEENVYKTCMGCQYYIPHYIKVDNTFKRSAFGHCTFPQIKVRTVDHLACVYYVEADRPKEQ